MRLFGKPLLKGNIVYLHHLLCDEGDIERFDVGHKVLNLATANNRMQERRLVHRVRNGRYLLSNRSILSEMRLVENMNLTGSDVLCTDLLSDDFERGPHIVLVIGALPRAE